MNKVILMGRLTKDSEVRHLLNETKTVAAREGLKLFDTA